MTQYDIVGFGDWLRAKHNQETVSKYLKPIRCAAEAGISWGALQNMSSEELYLLVNGRVPVSPKQAGKYRCGISSYAHYLDYKERRP